MKRFVFLVLVVLAALPGERIVAQDAPVTTVLTGSAFVDAVRAGDTLRTIGARFGASKSTVGTRHWPTPVGAFTVLDKEANPTWDVPLSIQDEMRRRLSFPSLGIHGTTAPGSIYSYA